MSVFILIVTSINRAYDSCVCVSKLYATLIIATKYCLFRDSAPPNAAILTTQSMLNMFNHYALLMIYIIYLYKCVINFYYFINKYKFLYCLSTINLIELKLHLIHMTFYNRSQCAVICQNF